jgi:hypothetical protein
MNSPEIDVAVIFLTIAIQNGDEKSARRWAILLTQMLRLRRLAPREIVRSYPATGMRVSETAKSGKSGWRFA